MRYIVNIYSKRKRYLRKYHPAKLKKGNSHYYRIYFPNEKDSKPLLRKLERKHIRYKAYPEEYARNTNYRKMFFRQTKGPYRCRYCNKKLSEDEITIDHIIPVKQAKNNKKAQRILRRYHIENVNQLENLAPCCHECNEAKGSQLGEWTKKGFLGFFTYHLYRILFFICRLLILTAIIYYCIITFS